MPASSGETVTANPSERRPAWSRNELSPVALLRRAATAFGASVGIHDGDARVSYSELLARAERVAGALHDAGVRPGDRVAVLLPNVASMIELHFAVAGSGAVLVPLNTRLDAEELRYVLEHSGARLLVADARFAATAGPALAGLSRRPQHVWRWQPPPDAPPGAEALEPWVAAAAPRALEAPDESAALSVNYTSGTTGRPKGVVYTHRGAFLQALNVIAAAGLHPCASYLWTLPMFHCHGWAFVWAVTGVGARHVCLDRVDPPRVWQQLSDEGVTHMCGAPTVLTLLLGDADARAAERPIQVLTGGAPPSPTLIERASAAGWRITHLYGLTETYGPSVVCERRPAWSELDEAGLAAMLSRQGVPGLPGVDVRVVDADLRDVPADGRTLGEVVMRGNTVTPGYFHDETATKEAFEGGWFHSGDLAVRHDDGSLELRDRLKDVVISGGENIATIEVEQAVAAHPAVEEVAVVAVPDERWGETPKAFVVLRPGSTATVEELTDFARGRLAGFKAPRHVEVVSELPKTATGKIQKFLLREAERRSPTGSAD